MSNSKIYTIFTREYTTRVRNKAFIIGTILVPILYIIVMAIPGLMATFMGESKGEVVAIVDRTGLYKNVFESNEHYQFVIADKPLKEYQEREGDDDKDDKIAAVLEIRENLLEHPGSLSLYSFETLPKGLEAFINDRLSEYLRAQKIESYDIPQLKKIIQDSNIKIKVSTYRWQKDSNQAKDSDENVYMLFGFIMAVLIDTLIMMYAFMFMQSVLEEKTNRVMEVMLTSVRPFDMMMGKLLGVVATVFTQLAIWVVVLSAISIGGSAIMFSQIDPTVASESLNASGNYAMGDIKGFINAMSNINFFEIGIFIFLYFLGGFFLYASILGAVAASVSSQEDAQLVARPITIILIIASYIGIGSAYAPGSSLAFWASMIPFTSPFAMITRICFGVPLWQELLSVSLLFATTIGFVFISGRIYRVGALMYGKKPSLRELIRWIRY